MTNRKRIYYVPGIISLIFIPVLLIIKSNYEINKSREYCIEYYTLLESDKKEFTYEIPARRNYINVKIDGNRSADSLRFLFIQNFAQALDQSKNTTLGIKIIFNNTIKYKTFIETINCLLKAKCQTFIPIQDTLFVYYMNRTDSCLNSNVPNNWSCIDYIFFYDDSRSMEERKRDKLLKLKNDFVFYLHYWPIFLMYILLVILTLRKIIKN